MSQIIASSMLPVRRIFTKETLDIKGKPVKIECIEIGGQTFSISRRLLTVVRLEDEWYEDVEDPQMVISALKENANFRPDLFTFWQRNARRSAKVFIFCGVGRDRCASSHVLRPLVEASD